jgi:MOSC domain-containing protein YiiM
MEQDQSSSAGGVSAFAEMIARYAQPGRIERILLRPERRGVVQEVAEAALDESGLDGDHARGGKRAVTLLQAEHLGVIGAFLGRGAVDPLELRRNLLVSGLNLAALKRRRLRLGTALIGITGPCAPCSRMERNLGPGGYSAMRGHGGWYAEVLEPGVLRCGDAVTPEPDKPGAR